MCKITFSLYYICYKARPVVKNKCGIIRKRPARFLCGVTGLREFLNIKNNPACAGLNFGRDRIRTYVGRSPTVLQTVAFDHSATLPKIYKNRNLHSDFTLLKQLGTYIITKK